MIVGIYHFITVLISWWIGLSFIRADKTAILFNSAISAFFCAVAAAILKRIGLQNDIFLAEIVIFVLATVALQLQLRGAYGDSVIAFLLSLSANAVLSFVGKRAVTEPEPRGIMTSLFFVAFFLYMTRKWAERFPGSDWREYYTETSSVPGRIELRIWHDHPAGCL